MLRRKESNQAFPAGATHFVPSGKVVQRHFLVGAAYTKPNQSLEDATGQTKEGIVWGDGRQCSPSPLCSFDSACVYTVTSTTTCVLPVSLNAHKHIGQHKYKADIAERFGREWGSVERRGSGVAEERGKAAIVDEDVSSPVGCVIEHRQMIYLVKSFLACTLLLVSGFCCAQNDAEPQGTSKKDSCPNCLVKDFAGQLLTDFELPLLGGGKLQLSNLRGKAVVLNLWCRCGANDTDPNKAEIPTLVELQDEYGPEGFQVIGYLWTTMPAQRKSLTAQEK